MVDRSLFLVFNILLYLLFSHPLIHTLVLSHRLFTCHLLFMFIQTKSAVQLCINCFKHFLIIFSKKILSNFSSIIYHQFTHIINIFIKSTHMMSYWQVLLYPCCILDYDVYCIPAVYQIMTCNQCFYCCYCYWQEIKKCLN